MIVGTMNLLAPKPDPFCREGYFQSQFSSIGGGQGAARGGRDSAVACIVPAERAVSLAVPGVFVPALPGGTQGPRSE